MYIISILLVDGKQTTVVLEGGEDGDGEDLERARPRTEESLRGPVSRVDDEVAGSHGGVPVHFGEWQYGGAKKVGDVIERLMRS